MKRRHTLALLSAFAVLGAGAASPAAEATGKIVTPQEIIWGAGPASLPAGAQAALLYGDMTKEGPFALRLKFPAGYRISPHTHPVDEVVTVISGTLHFAMTATVDDSKAKALAAGSFFSVPLDTAHYAFAEGETVVQINSMGPWAITYLDPKNDPRQATQ